MKIKLKESQLKELIEKALKNNIKEDYLNGRSPFPEDREFDSDSEPLPKQKNYDLKQYMFEVYTKNPETGEEGWDIKFVMILAKDIKEAKQILMKNDLFDEIITGEVVGYLDSGDLTTKEYNSLEFGLWGDDPNELLTESKKTSKKQKKFDKVMGEFGGGDLKTPSGDKVTD